MSLGIKKLILFFNIHIVYGKIKDVKVFPSGLGFYVKGHNFLLGLSRA